MKKLFPIALVASLACPLFAQENLVDEEEAPVAPKVERSKEKSEVWPAFIALNEWPHVADVVGLRLTLPYSSSQENVTGVDFGFWGRSHYFEGLQLNLLRNDVSDNAAGIQVGCYNSIGIGDMTGIQVGLWNEAVTFRGVQAGLVNLAGDCGGFQIGLINRAESMHGYQVGLINIIREAEIHFMPVVNIGF